MRDYDEFVARLRSEIEEADLGSRAPRVEGVELGPRRGPARRLLLFAAAAVLAAAGVGGYAGYDAYAGRRVLREDNRQFIDALFERGLLEVPTVSAAGREPISERGTEPAGAD